MISTHIADNEAVIDHQIDHYLVDDQLDPLIDKLTNKNLITLAKFYPERILCHPKLIVRLTDLELLEVASSNIRVMEIIINMPWLMDKIEHLHEKGDNSFYAFKNIKIVNLYFENYKKLKSVVAYIDEEDILIFVP